MNYHLPSDVVRRDFWVGRVRVNRQEYKESRTVVLVGRQKNKLFYTRVLTIGRYLIIYFITCEDDPRRNARINRAI